MCENRTKSFATDMAGEVKKNPTYLSKTEK